MLWCERAVSRRDQAQRLPFRGGTRAGICGGSRADIRGGIRADIRAGFGAGIRAGTCACTREVSAGKCRVPQG